MLSKSPLTEFVPLGRWRTWARRSHACLQDSSPSGARVPRGVKRTASARRPFLFSSVPFSQSCTGTRECLLQRQEHRRLALSLSDDIRRGTRGGTVDAGGRRPAPRGSWAGAMSPRGEAGPVRPPLPLSKRSQTSASRCATLLSLKEARRLTKKKKNPAPCRSERSGARWLWGGRGGAFVAPVQPASGRTSCRCQGTTCVPSPAIQVCALPTRRPRLPRATAQPNCHPQVERWRAVRRE